MISSPSKVLSVQAIESWWNLFTTEQINEKNEIVIINLLEFLNKEIVLTNNIKIFDLIELILETYH